MLSLLNEAGKMDRRKAIWIIGSAVAIALIAIVALVVTKLSGKQGGSGKEPTPTVLPEVPEGSVLVWRLSEVRGKQKDDRGTMEWAETFSYDELGRCTEHVSYTGGKQTGRVSYTYDAGTHQTMSRKEYTDDTDVDRRDEITYDARGREVLERYYSRDGSSGGDGWLISNEETHTYGIADNGLEYVDYYSAHYEHGEVQQERRDYYDPKERKYLKQERVGGSDPWITDREIRYDEAGRETAEYAITDFETVDDSFVIKETALVRERLYKDDGTCREFFYNGPDRSLSVIMEYDADGNKLKATNYDPDGQTLEYRIWTYTSDKNGRSEKMEKYYPDGTMEYWSLEEFDKDDEILRRTVYIASEKTESVGYLREVNALGQTVRESRYELETTEYTYDENGNRVHATFERENDCTISWEYIYTPMVLTEAQAAEAEEYYVVEYRFP